jgi:hypothetical protein
VWWILNSVKLDGEEIGKEIYDSDNLPAARVNVLSQALDWSCVGHGVVLLSLTAPLGGQSHQENHRISSILTRSLPTRPDSPCLLVVLSARAFHKQFPYWKMEVQLILRDPTA